MLGRPDRADPGGLRLLHRRHGFPEVHPEAPDLDHDLRYLKRKVDAGATFLITQLFFENEDYFRFVESAREAGIEVPIIAGIMPITNFEQVKRFTTMCGSTIPPALHEQLEARNAEGDEAVTELGVAYATLQCADLLERGAPGIHFYTLNKSPATRAILSALKAWRPSERAPPALRLLLVRRPDAFDPPGSLQVGQEAQHDRQRPAHHRWLELRERQRYQLVGRGLRAHDGALDLVELGMDLGPVRLDVGPDVTEWTAVPGRHSRASSAAAVSRLSRNSATGSGVHP